MSPWLLVFPTIAVVPVSKFITTLGSRVARTRQRRPAAQNGSSGRVSQTWHDPVADQYQPLPPAGPPAPSLERMLLDKFPTFNPEWPAEVQAKWFDSFGGVVTAIKERPR